MLSSIPSHRCPALHLVHTLLLVQLGHVYLGLELAHDVDVAFRNAACERDDDTLPPVAIDDASVDFFYKRLGGGHALINSVYGGLVTFSVRVRYIIAQPDVAPLHRRIQLGELTDNLIIKVIDSTVILPQLLDALGRDEAATNQVLQHAFGNPLRILHLALVPGKLTDEIRSDELQLEVWIKTPTQEESNTHSCFPSQPPERDV